MGKSLTSASLFVSSQERIEVQKQFDINEYIESVGRKLVSEIEDARMLGADANAKGAGIESATRKQIEALLPSVLGIGQGYIVDSYGNRSRQIDLIVFERSLCPVFSINDTPESTYYPCEGVMAAIEIKSSLAKKGFEDACKKADSVRQLRRNFNEEKTEMTISSSGYIKRPPDDVYCKSRRYGQISEDTAYNIFHKDRSHFGDILTCMLTGESTISTSTICSYANSAYRSTPDLITCLDGICAWGLDGNGRLTNSRFALKYSVNNVERPFGTFVSALYYQLIYGRTTLFEDYLDYFHKS